MITKIKKWVNGRFYKEITVGNSTIKLMSFKTKERAETYGNDFYKELQKEICKDLIDTILDEDLDDDVKLSLLNNKAIDIKNL